MDGTATGGSTRAKGRPGRLQLQRYHAAHVVRHAASAARREGRQWGPRPRGQTGPARTHGISYMLWNSIVVVHLFRYVFVFERVCVCARKRVYVGSQKVRVLRRKITRGGKF